MINPNLSNLNNAALQYLTSLSKEEIEESGLNIEQFLIPQVQPIIPEVQPTIPQVQPQQYQAAQEGGPIENAETDLETRLGPMGVINDNDGSPGPSLGGEGVADDLTMEVPEGSYILNSDAVSLIGISDINKVIRDAYTIAAALGQELPADYDPQNKVPIRISNGEAVIPAPLVGVIGLDRLERWNEKGLEVRRQREEAEKAQAETQAAQPVTEAPPVQPMQAQMSGMMGFKDGDEVEDDRDLATRIADFLGLGTLWRAGEITEDSLKQKALDILDPKNIPSFQDGGPPLPKSSWEKFVEGVRDTPENVLNWVSGPSKEEDEDPFTIDLDFIKKLDSWMAKNKPKEDYLNTNNALVLSETIAMQESDSDPDSRQKPDSTLRALKNLLKTGNIWSPGRGLHQYEKEFGDLSTQDAAETAVNRARSFDPNIYWLSKFEDANEDFDIRKLTGKEQTELFLIDHLTGVQNKNLSPTFITTVNNDNLTAEQAFEYYINHHKRKGSVGKKRRQEFIDNYNRNKNKVYRVLRRGEN